MFAVSDFILDVIHVFSFGSLRWLSNLGSSFFPSFKLQLVKLPSHDRYEIDLHYIMIYTNTYVPTYLQRCCILFYIEKQYAHSGKECGFWSRTTEESKAPEIATCPRSHFIGNISIKGFAPEWEWLQCPSFEPLLASPLYPVFLFVLLLYKIMKYFLQSCILCYIYHVFYAKQIIFTFVESKVYLMINEEAL